MSSLVKELRADALNSSVSGLNLLHQALVDAEKLEVKEFERWIKLELDGYPDPEEIPPYRFLEGQFYRSTAPLGKCLDLSLLIISEQNKSL